MYQKKKYKYDYAYIYIYKLYTIKIFNNHTRTLIKTNEINNYNYNNKIKRINNIILLFLFCSLLYSSACPQ